MGGLSSRCKGAMNIAASVATRDMQQLDRSVAPV